MEIILPLLIAVAGGIWWIGRIQGTLSTVKKNTENMPELNTSIGALQQSAERTEKQIDILASKLFGPGGETGFIVDVNNRLVKLEMLLERQVEMLAQSQDSIDKLQSTLEGVDRKIKDQVHEEIGGIEALVEKALKFEEGGES